MEIFVLSDLHGDEALIEGLRRVDTDLIVIIGDFITRTPISYVMKILDAVPNLLAIHGNCDPPQVVDMLDERGVSLHKKRVDFGQFNFVGYGGSGPTPFGTPSEKKEEEILADLEGLEIDSKTVLFTHAPPKGYFDMTPKGNAGSTAIREIIEKKKPYMNVCGHIHEHEGKAMLGDTIIVKVGSASRGRAAILDLENGGVNFISI
ncbi:MAG: metallophosphoesterase family protein [Candidatus Micrarchaeia archaeon]